MAFEELSQSRTQHTPSAASPAQVPAAPDPTKGSPAARQAAMAAAFGGSFYVVGGLLSEAARGGGCQQGVVRMRGFWDLWRFTPSNPEVRK